MHIYVHTQIDKQTKSRNKIINKRYLNIYTHVYIQIERDEKAEIVGPFLQGTRKTDLSLKFT